MNKEYIYTKDGVIVGTDKGLEKRSNLNNTKEILETQNNIEEIEDNLKNHPSYRSINYITNRILNTRIKKMVFFNIIILAITVLSVIITPLTLDSTLTVLMSLLGIDFFYLIPSLFLADGKAIKINKNCVVKSEKLLESELEKQKENLKQLEIESKVVNDIVTSNPKKIERTELIKDLKRKLYLISEYEINRKKCINLEKKGIIVDYLKRKEFSDSEISFIRELIKQDLDSENVKERAKTKKLEKK